MASAVAVFNGPDVVGTVEFIQRKSTVLVNAAFTALPPGQHGFHIHRAGDLRGEGCQGACDHWHKGKGAGHKGTAAAHGGPPGTKGPRHTGDLGNITLSNSPYTFQLKNVQVDELYGRSVIVHADPDDLGKGEHEDSLTTGHSGARIGCAIIGRCGGCETNKTRKHKN
jgi:Cu-Zn family superoxide dismutase